MSDAVDTRITELTRAVEALTSTVEAQQATLDRQEAELERLRAAAPASDHPSTDGARIGRRTLLGLSGAGVVGAVIATAEPAAADAVTAAAADGDALQVGGANAGDTGTSLTINDDTDPVLTLDNDGLGLALRGISGETAIEGTAGLIGVSGIGTGVGHRRRRHRDRARGPE